MRGKRWSAEEVEYLEDKWGTTSIPSIAKNLGRSIEAVKNKAFEVGLQRFTHQGEYITFHQLICTIGQKQNYSYLNEKLQRDGFPIKYKTMINESVKIVYLDEFWKWSKENQTKIDFSKFEENMLGPEEAWVKNKRRIDKQKKNKFKTTPWTNSEDKRLNQELNRYKYSIKELSKMFNRTEGAIQRRINDLGLKARPVRENPHNVWTKENFETLDKMLLERKPYFEMCKEIDKSEKAIRGKVYTLYGSENLDKAYLSLIKSKEVTWIGDNKCQYHKRRLNY